MFSNILNINCFITNEPQQTNNNEKTLDFFNPFEVNKINNNNVPGNFKPFLPNLDKKTTFPSKQYLEKENIFNPFEHFNLNQTPSPKIIITRFSRPRTYIKRNDINDSLDFESSINNISEQKNFHKHGKRRLRPHISRHIKRNRNTKRENKGKGFISKCLNYIKSISLIRILLYIFFISLFIFIGYQLRKNEEESNYVRLAPQ